MEKVPKLVVERLRMGMLDAEHPDPDVLTAFYERTLPNHERSQVLKHLAGCSECREILALALHSEEQTVSVVRPVRTGSPKWSRIRWALVAAGIVVVGSYGVLQYREASHPATVATNVPQQNKHVAIDAKNETTLPSSANKETPRAEKKFEALAGKPTSGKVDAGQPNLHDQSKEFDRLDQFAKLQAPPAERAEAISRGNRIGSLRPQSLPHGPKPPMQQWQQSINLAANANNNAYNYQQTPGVASAPAEARQQVVVTGQAPPLQAAGSNIGGPTPGNKESQDSDTLASAGRSTAIPAPTGSAAGTEVIRAKTAETGAANAPVATPAASPYSVSTADGSNFSQSGSLIPEPTRWSINAEGGLQRSTDQGKTWQDVDVNKEAEGADLNLQLAMKSSRVKALAKDNAKKERPDLRPIVFRAVAAYGPNVWAGGSGGALYHSADSGGHWAQVVPSMSGLLMTGDIISVQFFDTRHGRIITSTAEIWNTADGGQNWEKQ